MHFVTRCRSHIASFAMRGIVACSFACGSAHDVSVFDAWEQVVGHDGCCGQFEAGGEVSGRRS